MGPFDAKPNFEFTDEHKEQFARELLRNPVPFEAAIAVFGAEKVGVNAFVATAWPTDDKVIEFQREILKDDGEAGMLVPTKNAALLRVWEWTESKNVDIETKLKAMKLLADMQGWIVKPDPDAFPGGAGSLIPPTVTYVLGEDHDKPPTALADAG